VIAKNKIDDLQEKADNLKIAEETDLRSMLEALPLALDEEKQSAVIWIAEEDPVELLPSEDAKEPETKETPKVAAQERQAPDVDVKQTPATQFTEEEIKAPQSVDEKLNVGLTQIVAERRTELGEAGRRVLRDAFSGRLWAAPVPAQRQEQTVQPSPGPSRSIH
jgi:hypothetical protein